MKKTIIGAVIAGLFSVLVWYLSRTYPATTTPTQQTGDITVKGNQDTVINGNNNTVNKK